MRKVTVKLASERETQNAMAEERIKQLEEELAAVKAESERKDQLAEMQVANVEKDQQLEEMQAASEDKDRVSKEKDHELATVKAECRERSRT